MVTLEPVQVSGDVGAGARELVRRHGAQTTCETEKLNAFVSCPLISGGILTTLAAAPTIVGGAAGLVATIGLSVQCGRDLRALLACDASSAARAEIGADCDARGGTQLVGASENEVVCLVVR